MDFNIESIIVFPEAYACLRTLSSQGKLSAGMSLLVDIGGGTTDISFFSIEYGDIEPKIYHYTSIPKGLNYLTRAEERTSDRRADSNVVSQKEIDAYRVIQFCNQIKGECDRLLSRLHMLFRQETKLRESRLDDALRGRPIVYVGGGSAFPILRATYVGFSDQKQISVNDWNTLYIKDLHNVKRLCHILSTAYGLSIGAKNDNITLRNLSQLFDGIKGVEEDEDDKYNQRAIQQERSYKQDYIYKEYGTLNYQKKKRPKI